MRNKLARIHAGGAQLAPALAHAYHNDNPPNGPRAALPGLQRLACHWRPGAADGRLECYWQVEPAETEAQRQSFMIATTASAARRALGNRTMAQTYGRAP